MDICSENIQSHTPLHSASSGHEIQRRHIVSASRNCEAVVRLWNEGATVRPRGPQQEQELAQRQEPAQRQPQQLERRNPSRNDSGILQASRDSMQTYNNLYPKLCEYDNLLLAFRKAKRDKSGKEYVQRFEKNLPNELFKLQWELLTGIYKPAPLTTFTVRDPKTRKISASHFRDRVVHHAICNIIEPIFETRFIFDTFANRKGKGTSAILKRFDSFKRKVGPSGFVLKADIRHYFQTVDQQILMGILARRVRDEQLLALIKIILENHKTEAPGKGMPLGNLTSQFFANIYLAELDNFVKHELRAKYYLRYVDDFVILSRDQGQLENWKAWIDAYISTFLHITIHPDKTKIIRLQAGVPLVGFRIFQHHKLLKKSNLRRLERRVSLLKKGMAIGTITPEHVRLSMTGWEGYAKMGNTFTLRQEVLRELTQNGNLEGTL